MQKFLQILKKKKIIIPAIIAIIAMIFPKIIIEDAVYDYSDKIIKIIELFEEIIKINP